MSRKQFVESHGATCRNWTFSWSFINEAERTIIFGGWDEFTNGKTAMILSDEWRINKQGRKSPRYSKPPEFAQVSVNDRMDLIQLASAEPVIVPKLYGFDPEFAGPPFTANMDVRRFIAIEAVEVEAVRAGNALDGRHACRRSISMATGIC